MFFKRKQLVVCIAYAGVLAGIWPSGTITLLSELFVAESKSQVYGNLHAFLHNNSESTSKLGKTKSFKNFEIQAFIDINLRCHMLR